MTKKQHFIPRAAYLRNFSNTKNSDDRKNALQFLDVQSLHSGMSNVYDLGCENCLYEDSNLDFNAVETFLAEIESDLTPELSAIEKETLIENITDEIENDFKNVSFDQRIPATVLARQERDKIPEAPENKYIKLSS